MKITKPDKGFFNIKACCLLGMKLQGLEIGFPQHHRPAQSLYILQITVSRFSEIHIIGRISGHTDTAHPFAEKASLGCNGITYFHQLIRIPVRFQCSINRILDKLL